MHKTFERGSDLGNAILTVDIDMPNFHARLSTPPKLTRQSAWLASPNLPFSTLHQLVDYLLSCSLAHLLLDS